MSEVLVMTDTVACIPGDLAREHNIKVVPAANIMFDNKDYIDGVTLTAAEAYELIKKDPDKFLTSAVTPALLVDEYRKVAAEAQNIFFVTLSSALSAAYKTAGMAAEVFQEESPKTTIQIFDSRSCAGGQGLIVLATAKAANKGQSMDRVASVAEQARQKTNSFMMLDTLRYVYRTGRMSKLGSRIASMFNIKPINRVTGEGKLEMVDRTRNRDDGLEILIELTQKHTKTDSLHFMLSHAAAPEMAEKFSGMLQKKFNCLSLIISDYSPVMGYGAGPGAIFVAFHPELDLLK
jgi:DegV family protein with EDD domain